MYYDKHQKSKANNLLNGYKKKKLKTALGETEIQVPIVFFDFPVKIRAIIHTTNLIEKSNEKIRKYTKNKLSFPTDQAGMKFVYLALMELLKNG